MNLKGNYVFRKLIVVTLALNLAASTTSAWAQPANRPPIIGLMSFAASSDDPQYEAFRGALRDLGYVPGRSINIAFRNAQGRPERLPTIAKELVELKADVIVVGNTPAAQAVKRATSTIPIVIVTSDPVASGLVNNLSHPEGNLTGLSTMSPELSGKRLELLKEAIPSLTRLAVLWSSPAIELTPFQVKTIESLQSAASSMSIELKIIGVQTSEDFKRAFIDISHARAQAIYFVESPLFYGHRKSLTMLALQARLPAIYGTSLFVQDGGLMSYGADFADLARRAAQYVDKLLKGAKPFELPVEQARTLELAINLKTAKTLGLSIPESILARADLVFR